MAEVQTIEPKQLAVRMGISPKRLRALLRSKYSRKAELKGKAWEIPMDLAKKVREDYKAAKAIKEKAKVEQTQKELKGEA